MLTSSTNTRTNDRPTPTDSHVKLRTLQHKLEVKGEFQTVIRNRTCGKVAKFVVVSGGIHSPPLISKETLTELGMLKIQPDGYFAEPNDLAVSKQRHSVNTVKQEKGEQDLKDLITKYSHLFQGIGKIENKKNGSEILGSTNQPSEESLQSQEDPGQRDSLDEDVVYQSSKDANQQLQDYPTLSTTLAQETPRPVQDMARLTKHKPRPAHDVPIAESSSRPRREQSRPAYLTDYVT